QAPVVHSKTQAELAASAEMAAQHALKRQGTYEALGAEQPEIGCAGNCPGDQGRFVEFHLVRGWSRRITCAWIAGLRGARHRIRGLFRDPQQLAYRSTPACELACDQEVLRFREETRFAHSQPRQAPEQPHWMHAHYAETTRPLPARSSRSPHTSDSITRLSTSG